MFPLTRTLGSPMPFGKFRGRDVEDLEGSYLKWCLGLDDLPLYLRQEILAVLEERRQAWLAGQTAAEPRNLDQLPELVRGWYRELVMLYHPDRGGSAEACRVVIVAHQRLKEKLGL